MEPPVGTTAPNPMETAVFRCVRGAKLNSEISDADAALDRANKVGKVVDRIRQACTFTAGVACVAVAGFMAADLLHLADTRFILDTIINHRHFLLPLLVGAVVGLVAIGHGTESIQLRRRSAVNALSDKAEKKQLRLLPLARSLKSLSREHGSLDISPKRYKEMLDYVEEHIPGDRLTFEHFVKPSIMRA